MSESRVLLTRRFPPAAAELLHAAGHRVHSIDHDEPCPRDRLLGLLSGAAGVITTLTERVDHEFLAAAGPSLRVVANFAVGYDNIDLAACKAAGVRATNTPGVLTEATADATWTLILSAARRVIEGDQLVRSGHWSGWAPLQLLGLELAGATLGIVGAGRIGLAVARRAVGFQMQVIYSDPRPSEELERLTGARRVELDELLSVSDVVTLHVPMRPENRHMIGAAQLRRMKPTAVLVNAARGPLVDEAALVSALQTHRIAAAGLDVYEHEPRLGPGLKELHNAVLLPHLGSATAVTRERMARVAAENVVAVLAGREPANALV